MSSKKQYRTISPNPDFFSRSPQALIRDISTTNQKRWDEGTILWGENDALPLRILEAIEESPTTTSCLDVHTDFVTGYGFSDPGLMNMVIDKEGTTLWQLHCQLAEYEVKLEGFSCNFKYNGEGKIAYAYNLPIEFNRFVKPGNDKDRNIKHIKYNPYFGTDLYNADYTTTYNVFDIKNVLNEYAAAGNDYKGQVYFDASTRALYKFYPVPKYWTGKKWIYVDGKIQEFHAENLDNGFFQSVLLNIIGDPNQLSKNPIYQKTVTGDDGVKRKESDGTTVGQEFNNMMSTKFSGSKKAGTVMALWSQNKETAPELTAFPTNTNFDVLQGTFTDAIRGITIATKTPAILANLPQQASSLGSDGQAIQKSIELMQSRSVVPKRKLENFYNNILLPNFQTKTSARVKILEYKPVSTIVEIDDKFWEVLSTDEKRKFVKDNFPNVSITDPVLPAPGTPTEPVQTNEFMTNLKARQLEGIQRIVRKFNKEQLTFEQAKQLLKGGFAMTDEDVNVWLVTNEEE